MGNAYLGVVVRIFVHTTRSVTTCSSKYQSFFAVFGFLSSGYSLAKSTIPTSASSITYSLEGQDRYCDF